MFELTVPLSPTDHTIGPAHATVAVVEYGDFECPNCKQAAPAVKLLLNHFTGRIRFAYRHFPLEEVHPHALHAAEASECAGSQGKFWPFHDALFEHQPHLELDDLRNYAGRLQLDMAAFESEMSKHVHVQRIRDHIKSGRASGARSTPTFFVAGRICDVSYDLKSLFDAVEAALRK